MAENQRTLKSEVKLTGKGLHTGVNVNLVIKPAPENSGIVFRRVDLEGEQEVKALAEYVVDTARGTTIEKNGVRVSTIEHLMAALASQRVDNAVIDIDGPEVPIMGGSSRMFLNAILEVGIQEQDAEREYLVIDEKIEYRDEENGVEICIYPDDKFNANVLIDYNSKVLGHQYAELNSLDDFDKEIASCRTFVFFHELEVLLKHNLIKGGDLENAIVIMENPVEQSELDRIADLFNKPHVQIEESGVLNNIKLSYSNEPARHKLLDLIGDLALVGMPIKARVIAKRPGHLANTELAKKIRQMLKKPKAPKYDPEKEPVYDVNGIKKMLPHRPPFLLVDKIIELTENSVTGMKNVTMNEPFFVGHFPEEPVMPGVLMVEAMAQTGGILVLSTVPDPENYSTYFMKIDNVKFKRKVVPGDTLLFRLELISPVRRGIVHMSAKAYVGNSVAVEAELMAQVIKNK
ncbi:MAG: bifunctional UDP-3-O-[3-hydroxymyristoyl] N-acetylglucosamine deacetylase/3-hydroxyacyl-ACP dehydratase [Bacteroidales bacterium]|jgi:UDP-3-O-[3-hydroxymyristoyl] N-acetylglucosamine deacetylase/3-hydroxyacyl-[acyl-carrier-protein] dehydratase|nr:bifunctional UDP-3-O-[3-hydroxymyristoyl] N-acetylglucosamine deacetylase/3-hydroxyacyl-ACP dehydratase [Bacteroidales bacterium]